MPKLYNGKEHELQTIRSVRFLNATAPSFHTFGRYFPIVPLSWASLVAQLVKNPPALRETWLWSLGRSPGEGKGNPLQYSGLENSMDCIIHGVAKSRTWLRYLHFHFHPFLTGLPLSTWRGLKILGWHASCFGLLFLSLLWYWNPQYRSFSNPCKPRISLVPGKTLHFSSFQVDSGSQSLLMIFLLVMGGERKSIWKKSLSPRGLHCGMLSGWKEEGRP